MLWSLAPALRVMFSPDLSGSLYFSGRTTQFLITSGGAALGAVGGIFSPSPPLSRPPGALAWRGGWAPGGGGLDTATLTAPPMTPDTRYMPSGWITPDRGSPSAPI